MTTGLNFCDGQLIAEVREIDPTDDGWRRFERTGRVSVVCRCGLNTGWIDATSEAYETLDQHTMPQAARGQYDAEHRPSTVRVHLAGADHDFLRAIKRLFRNRP